MTPNKPLTITLPANVWESILADLDAIGDIEDISFYGSCLAGDVCDKLRSAYESAIIAAIDEEGKK